ncbi:MAG: hypothetical protein PF795_11810 [Kiritimatiellae bacterium]|nr:hypothetical protein [Kiritimatiellia bacterium]
MVLIMAILPLRAELVEAQWSRSQTAEGRIRVVARDVALMQTVSVWATRSLGDLEREWGLPIPFQADYPVMLMGSDQANQVTLQQEFRKGVLRQRIYIPEPMDVSNSRELARIFTRALAVRVMMAALPSDAKASDVEVPVWLELGSATRLMGSPILLQYLKSVWPEHSSAIRLMDARQRDLFSGLMASEYTRRLAYPEEIVRRDRRDVTPLAEAEAGLLCRWIFRRAGATQAQKREMWASFAARDALDVATLSHQSGQSRDLREFHQHWDLWWQQEQLRLMAEFRLSESVLNALRRELRFLPGFYGLYREDLDRSRYVRFEQLEDYLDDPAFASAMVQWSLRLQSLRFRQPKEINDLIARFQQAISTLASASREKGKERQELWTQALDQWHQALGVMRVVDRDFNSTNAQK